MKRGKYIPILLALTLSWANAGAEVHHYPAQYASFGEALTACAHGDTVLIAEGVYSAEEDRNIVYSGAPVVIIGLGGPDSTVFSCEQDGFWIRLQNVGTEGDPFKIEGVAIRDAHRIGYSGGAIECDDCYIRLDSVWIENCYASAGAAVSFSRGDFRMTGCRISGNSGSAACVEASNANIEVYDTEFRDNSSGGDGGAVYLSNCQSLFTGAAFEGNLSLIGAGMSVAGGQATIEGSVFLQNECGLWGGALRAVSLTAFSVADCEFVENVSHTSGGAVDIRGQYGPSEVVYIGTSVFVSNQSDYGGSAIHCQNSVELTLESCTVDGNALTIEGDGASVVCAINSSINVSQCIITNGLGGYGVWATNSESATIQCSDVWGNQLGELYGDLAGQLAVEGNFSSDPLYCPTPSGLAYTLREDSPCLGQNNSCGVLIGALGVGCDSVSVENTSWSQVKTRF